jgi:hypothetical protein
MIWDFTTEELIDELESRGVKVDPHSIGSLQAPPTNLHEELCQQFDLSRHTTTDKLLNHIRSLL